MKATINQSTLTIPPIKLPGGALSATQVVDLTPYQGHTARIYINAAGLVEINPGDSYWQVAEVALPPAVVTGGAGETPPTEQIILPLDLAQHAVTLFDLPE